MIENNKIFILLISSFLLSVVLIPVLRKFAFMLDICDYPSNKLKIHSTVTPYLGGGSIFIPIYVIMMLFLQKALIPFFIGGLIIFLAGLFDDWKGLPAKFRLILEILVGILIVLPKNYIFSEEIAKNSILLTLAIFLSIFIISSSINSINLIDGLDGLAGGTVAIAAAGFLLLSIYNRNNTSVVLSIILIGACFGFLIFNFPKAKIFLGSAGSYFCGFVLGYLFLTNSKNFSSFVASGIIMGIFILDTSFAILRRKIKRKPIFIGDREHIYDKIFLKFKGIWKTLATLYLIEIVFVALGILSLKLKL